MEVVIVADDYEYHKQNAYPGERAAEQKRVADRAETARKKSDARVAEKGRTEGLKADARVAAKGRRDDQLMDSQMKRSSARAERVNSNRNAADTIGLVVIAGLIIILLAGSVWGYMAMEKQYTQIDKQSSEIDTLNSQLDRANSDNMALSQANNQACGLTDTTPPTILYLSPVNSVSPSNNAMDVATNVQITAMFSEDMDPLTVNEDSFVLMQRTTPETGVYKALAIPGTVTYSDREATFTSKDRFAPNQIYGNVFTVTIRNDVKDLAGNPLANDYVWSFTTGQDAFNTGTTTSQTS
jgi:outer membrane murein-binding lipoprotein Lpp